MDYNLNQIDQNKYQVVAEESEYFNNFGEALGCFDSLHGSAQLWSIEGEPKLLKEKGTTDTSFFQ